jgi:hypothetical protein
MAGLVVNVKNGIAVDVEIATILVRNVDLNRSQNLRKKRKKLRKMKKKNK